MHIPVADRARSYWLQALASLRVPGASVHVIGERETLQAICERRASIARNGDGEMEIMLGRSIYFQEYDPTLSSRLRVILRSATPQFLVGIPNFDSHHITRESKRRNWERYRRLFSHVIDPALEYHSTAVSRPGSVVGLEQAEHYRKFASIWSGREVVLVHHADVSTHPLFAGARRVHFVACLGEHAFRDYPALLQRARAFVHLPDVVFAIAAGPTAGVLAWDLAQSGVQALDVGHLTRAYDEFFQTS
jgi:hypothetical protein